MKKIENVTIYKCDFCKKELKREHAMVKHEEQCNCNPLNLRPCLDNCKYLIRKPVILGTGIDDLFTGEPITKTYNGFFCELKNIYLLHPKIEHKNKFIKSEITYNEKDNEILQESMPNKCNDYNSIYDYLNIFDQ